MIRYDREEHRRRLAQRLELFAPRNAAVALSRAASVDTPGQEELARRLMVRFCSVGRLPSGAALLDFVATLREFLEVCDPLELRLVDVAHNAYETLARALGPACLAHDALRSYPALLQGHLAALDEGRIHPHSVAAGSRHVIEPRRDSLRVLILADNFRAASGVWEACRGKLTGERLELLFCDNAKDKARFALRLLASLAALMLAGKPRLALSMVASRPRISTRPLADARNTTWLRARAFDLGLHSMGVIYRPETIAAFRLGILNAHIGHLPGMRGRSVLEWSIVLGVPAAVSTFFMDAGIDTGNPIVDRYLVPSETLADVRSVADGKARMFAIADACYARAVRRIAEGGEGIRNEPAGPRFYAMSDLLAAALVGR